MLIALLNSLQYDLMKFYFKELKEVLRLLLKVWDY